MYLALDIGDRYIGLAATDHEGRLTYRYGTIDRKSVDGLVELQKIVEKEKTQVLVVGVPIGLEGQETKQTVKTREFIVRLKATLPSALEIAETSEVLSSVEARQNIKAEGGEKTLEHAEAARILLEDYLKQSSQSVQ
jgi:putative holliday junction resolvase